MTTEQKHNITWLNQQLNQNGIGGKIVGAINGPVITTYKFESATGVRLSTLAKKICAAFTNDHIRVAHIPNTNYVGLEIPNLTHDTVCLTQLIADKKFETTKYNLPIALGVTTNGKPVYHDLQKMPHLLVCGRTGTGKTQMMYSVITSLATKYSPDECKFVIIDPKGADYGVFDTLPHLMKPVIKLDTDTAVDALKSLDTELSARYETLANAKKSSIEKYNQTAETKMPYIVVIIDELADMIVSNRSTTTRTLIRIMQRGRAAGIHLVVGTGRFGATTLPTTLKAYFPTRISFQVRSKPESIMTIGEYGAEQLLACGDALFADAGRVPVRIHTPFVSDPDLKKVIKEVNK